MNLGGILNVNKPAGWTSFDVVRFVRGRCGERRVGHAGTLDPAATGVLPLLIGRATRLTEYLMDATKEYVATIELGVETNTYDAEGEVTARQNASGVTEDAVRRALAAFQGEIEQQPPAFSAVKLEGVPLYKRARRGEDVHARARRVRVEQLDIISCAPPSLQLRIVSGKGFYVRSLAHDLGRALGVGGMLAGLVRTRVGTLGIDAAVDIETLRAEFEASVWQERLIAADEVLLGWRAAIINAENASHLMHGREAGIRHAPEVAVAPGDLARAYSAEGDFIAVIRSAGGGHWSPEKVFASGD